MQELGVPGVLRLTAEVRRRMNIGGNKMRVIFTAIIFTLLFGGMGLRTAEASSDPSLFETHWKLTHLNKKAVTSEASIFIEESRERFTGSGGCNRIFGVLEIGEKAVQFSGAGSTRMACLEDGVMQREAEFLDALQKATSYKLKGSTLKLMNGRRELARFTATGGISTGDTELESKKWLLASIKGTEVGEQEEQAFLVFDKEKASAGGNSSCNSFGGSYEAKEATIRFFDIIQTMRACIEDDRMEIERGFMSGLQEANRYEIREGRLHLFNGDTELLVFTGTDK